MCGLFLFPPPPSTQWSMFRSPKSHLCLGNTFCSNINISSSALSAFRAGLDEAERRKKWSGQTVWVEMEFHFLSLRGLGLHSKVDGWRTGRHNRARRKVVSCYLYWGYMQHCLREMKQEDKISVFCAHKWIMLLIVESKRAVPNSALVPNNIRGFQATAVAPVQPHCLDVFKWKAFLNKGGP